MAASIPTAVRLTPACSTAPALRGGGLHPNCEVWVRDRRNAERSRFKLRNKHRPQANNAFQRRYRPAAFPG
jgi:hypothetical protein